MTSDFDGFAHKTQSRISEFQTKFPKAVFGPAHILFDEQHVSDQALNYCFFNCHQWLEMKKGDENEIRAVMKFIMELQNMPEDER